jgi:hypothetical protein
MSWQNIRDVVANIRGESMSVVAFEAWRVLRPRPLHDCTVAVQAQCRNRSGRLHQRTLIPPVRDRPRVHCAGVYFTGLHGTAGEAFRRGRSREGGLACCSGDCLPQNAWQCLRLEVDMLMPWVRDIFVLFKDELWRLYSPSTLSQIG